MKKLLAIAFTTFIAASSLPALAGPNHGAKHDGQAKSERSQKGQRYNIKRMMHHYSHLDLSEAQQSDIKALLKEGVDQGKLKRTAIAKLHQQMKELKRAEQLDEQSLRSTNIEVANLKSDLMIMRLKKKQEIEALLTQEQLTLLQKMKAERKQQRGKNRG